MVDGWVDVEHGDNSKPGMSPLRTRDEEQFGSYFEVWLGMVLNYIVIIAARATWGYQVSTVQDVEVILNRTAAQYIYIYCLQYPM